jgi:hypothetical protein
MPNFEAVLSTYQFKRTGDQILVLNENSYLMAEYSERTGTAKWHRVLIASQRELIEQRLRDRFPSMTRATVSARVAAVPQAAEQLLSSRSSSRTDRRGQVQSPPQRRVRSSSAR